MGGAQDKPDAGGATQIDETEPASDPGEEERNGGDHNHSNLTNEVVAAGIPGPDAPSEGTPPMGYGVGVIAAGAAVRYGNTTATHLTTSAATTALPDHRWFLRGMAGLYSKFDDSDPLEHESRERLYETVVDAPGVHLSELCDRAGVTLSTARHHLRVLEDEGLIATAKHRGKRRYFPAGDDERELAAAMSDDAAATVLETLAYTGPATVSTLAEELGRDPSTVTHHLKRLDEDGLVARERDGRAVMNSLEPAVESALAPTVADADAPRQTGSAD
ncbi:helix-turn-helix domain-containing protein [Halostella sp. JP-L12]|nr:helix-turn-helix domain-containing protein [Halostella sp. JP-L12]